MKIVLDKEVCAGHGQCVDAAPEVFALDDDGYVVQLIENPDERYRAAVEDAARRCPEIVIKLVD
ncbi:MAG TPA: ferredoxin [Acidimicrobiales bacterium]|nr:ferredoxin [Acidimicrobiales bacterium]